MDEFLRGYMTCAVYMADENPPSGEWKEHGAFRIKNIAPDTAAKMKRDCDRFRANWEDKIQAALLDESVQPRYTLFTAGVDLFYSRNGHGAGYFDRGNSPAFETLQEAAARLGEFNLFLGADGLLYRDG